MASIRLTLSRFIRGGMANVMIVNFRLACKKTLIIDLSLTKHFKMAEISRVQSNRAYRCKKKMLPGCWVVCKFDVLSSFQNNTIFF